MKEILYNYDNLTIDDIEETVIRVKVLLINSKNELLFGYAHQTYQLVGGHLEKGESLVDCLNREILEETGIELNITEINPFMLISHYSKNYRNSGKNRCSKVYYFIVKNDLLFNLNLVNYTDSEKEGNFKLQYIHLNEIESVLTKSIHDNPMNKIIVEDTLEAIKEYQKIKKKREI